MVVLNGGRERARTVVTRETLWSSASVEKVTFVRQKRARSTTTSFRRCTNPCATRDVDAAIYWLARMLEAGEDPLYVARRLIRFASEDIGLADSPRAGNCGGGLSGVPFSGHAGVQRAPDACGYHTFPWRPSSNALYSGVRGGESRTRSTCWHEPVPLQIRNAPTRADGRAWHYGEGYVVRARHGGKAQPPWSACPKACAAGAIMCPARRAARRARSRGWRPRCAGAQNTHRAQSRSRKAKNKAGAGAARNPAPRHSRKAKNKTGMGGGARSETGGQVMPGPPGVPRNRSVTRRACPRGGRPSARLRAVLWACWHAKQARLRKGDGAGKQEMCARPFKPRQSVPHYG